MPSGKPKRGFATGSLSVEEMEHRRELASKGLKICNRCKDTKPYEEFHKYRVSKDGYNRWCIECVKEYQASRKEELKAYQDAYNREYRKTHKRGWTEKDNIREKKKRDADPSLRLRNNISRAVQLGLQKNMGSKRGSSILDKLPYTTPELKEHLESQFVEGMSWENYGEWHLDHIYPQSRLPYDSMTHPNFLKAWSLPNLQPLWAEDNVSKSDKILKQK